MISVNLFDPIFSWVEKSVFSVWLRESESLLAFPGVLVLHAIGMGLAGGAALLIALRLLGFARPIPLSSLSAILPVFWIGTWLAIASGVLLVIAFPTKALTNPLFYFKLACFGAALIVPGRMGIASMAQEVEEPGAAIRRLAIGSLLLWGAVIASGRLLAYTYLRMNVNF